MRSVFRCALLALCASLAWPQADGVRLERARRVWDSLSPARREAALANWRRYQAMPPARRLELRRRFERFMKMPEAKRAELIRLNERRTLPSKARAPRRKAEQAAPRRERRDREPRGERMPREPREHGGGHGRR